MKYIAIILLFKLIVIFSTGTNTFLQQSILPPTPLPPPPFLYTPWLVVIGRPTYRIPLKNININIKIVENLARVEIEQEYENNSPVALETTYNFPISSEAVFDSFKAIVGEKVIVGQIKELEQARTEFRERVAAGETVAISEINPATQDIMTVKIGNLMPYQRITIKYSYIEQMDIKLNDFRRLIIHSTLTPRYAPAGWEAPNITTVMPNRGTYKWQITTQIYTNSPINFLKVPTHRTNINYSNDKKFAEITLDGEYNPNKDYELYYSTEEVHSPNMLIEKYNNTNTTAVNSTANGYAGYITFIPKFSNVTDLQSAWNMIESGNNNTDIYTKASGEYIFIADRSGSMSGNRIVNLKQSLTELMRLLPEDSFFNIISFGTSYEPMYKESMLVKDKRDEAVGKIQTFDADMGGTEILQAVKYAIDTPVIKNIPKVIFLLTDGDVSNPDEIIKIARDSKNKVRINAIGLGSGASNYLIKNVAKAANGYYEFVKDSDNLSLIMKNLLLNAISSYLTDFKITFSNNDKITKTIPQLSNIPFILKNEPFSLYFFFNDYDENMTATIEYKDENNQTHTHTVKVKSAPLNGTLLHKFAHKQIIDDLLYSYKADKNSEEGKQIKQQIVDLSIKYQILTELTAFIVAIQDNEGNFLPLVPVNIPSIESTDYPGSSSMAMASTGPRAFGAGTFSRTSHAHSTGLAFNGNGGGALNESMDMAAVDSQPTMAPANRGAPASTNATASISNTPANDIHTLIPSEFWVNQTGQPGKDYVLLRFNNTFIGCNDQGQIEYDNDFDDDLLWKPIKVDDYSIAFYSDEYYIDLGSLDTPKLTCVKNVGQFSKFIISKRGVNGRTQLILNNIASSNLAGDLSVYNTQEQIILNNNATIITNTTRGADMSLLENDD
jgi:hypothetical protein